MPVKTTLKLLLAAAAMCLGTGTAYAQEAGADPSTGGVGSSSPNARLAGAMSDHDATRERDEALAKQRPRVATKSTRSVPATPEDITVGSELRDNKGDLVGTIDSVTMASAIVDYGSGKVAIPLEAVGKNNKGLLIGMSKADFLKMAATAQ
jgi:hypothetical protein